tara:strand:- start:3422 stop:4720 length:1299 start_codon:yes stop_codon:yes gene_type:complete
MSEEIHNELETIVGEIEKHAPHLVPKIEKLYSNHMRKFGKKLADIHGKVVPNSEFSSHDERPASAKSSSSDDERYEQQDSGPKKRQPRSVKERDSKPVVSAEAKPNRRYTSSDPKTKLGPQGSFNYNYGREKSDGDYGGLTIGVPNRHVIVHDTRTEPNDVRRDLPPPDIARAISPSLNRVLSGQARKVTNPFMSSPSTAPVGRVVQSVRPPGSHKFSQMTTQDRNDWAKDNHEIFPHLAAEHGDDSLRLQMVRHHTSQLRNAVRESDTEHHDGVLTKIADHTNDDYTLRQIAKHGGNSSSDAARSRLQAPATIGSRLRRAVGLGESTDVLSRLKIIKEVARKEKLNPNAPEDYQKQMDYHDEKKKKFGSLINQPKDDGDPNKEPLIDMRKKAEQAMALRKKNANKPQDDSSAPTHDDNPNKARFSNLLRKQ